jgi:hypothetical protein
LLEGVVALVETQLLQVEQVVVELVQKVMHQKLLEVQEH